MVDFDPSSPAQQSLNLNPDPAEQETDPQTSAAFQRSLFGGDEYDLSQPTTGTDGIFPGQPHIGHRDSIAPNTYNNDVVGGRAAANFNAQTRPPFSATNQATREQLGIDDGEAFIVDIGGEGQKEGGGVGSGNLHAMNINAQAFISPGEFDMTIKDGKSFILSAHETDNRFIPNRIDPGDWGTFSHFPIANEQVDGVMLEGSPLNEFNAKEMARMLDDTGWAYVSVSIDPNDPNDENLQGLTLLSNLHNGSGEGGGVNFKVRGGEDGSLTTYLIPPPGAKDINWSQIPGFNGPEDVTNENFHYFLDAYERQNSEIGGL